MLNKTAQSNLKYIAIVIGILILLSCGIFLNIVGVRFEAEGLNFGLLQNLLTMDEIFWRWLA